MIEAWKPCPGFEDIYHVSSSGRVKRIIQGAGRARVGAILRPGKNPKGYSAVCLCKNGTQNTRYIHRLVCEAFHGPAPSPTHQAAHKNDDKKKNTAENLYWATPKQNGGDDRRRHGKIMHGAKCGMAKLKDEDIPKIRAMCASGAAHREIAERFGVRKNTISRILSGKRWPHKLPVVSAA
jgi:hypothetical protein